MADWTDLEPDTKKAVKAPVRFALYKMRQSRARGRILITKDVLAELGMKTWRVDVRLGKGARQHQIAVVPNPDGKFELQELGKAKGGGTFGLNMPIVDRFPDAAVSPMERSYKIETEGKLKILVIDLPPFCWNQPDRERLMRGRAAA